jgi:hypothetical protein
VTLASPSESRASERSALRAATAGWSSALGFENAVDGALALTFELNTGCALVFAEAIARVGLRLPVVARVGLGILDCVLTTPRVWVVCLLLRRTSAIEGARIPTSARVPIIHASAWMVKLT